MPVNFIAAFIDSIVYPIPVRINYGQTTNCNLLNTLTPEIFWSFRDTSATSQTGYEIEVGSDQDWTVAEMWSTGPIMSTDTSIVYSGSTLSDHNTYWIRIRVRNQTVWGDWNYDWFGVNPFCWTG